MTSITTQYPTLCVEIHRYDNPDTIRFFDLVPTEAPDTSKINYHPFATSDDRGPNYVEQQRQQVIGTLIETNHRRLIDAGYSPVPYLELPSALALRVARTMAPIEWHSGLTTGELEVTKRVTVWVLGELDYA